MLGTLMAISHDGQMSLAVTTMPFRTIRSISIAAGVARSSGDQLSSEIIHELILAATSRQQQEQVTIISAVYVRVLHADR